VNEMMMIDPVDSDDDEAQDIGKKGWPHLRQGSWRRIVRRLQLQNHDGNENGDDAIAECFDPVRFHAPECNTGGFGLAEVENCESASPYRETRKQARPIVIKSSDMAMKMSFVFSFLTKRLRMS
jgi:hypothetical protein